MIVAILLALLQAAPPARKTPAPPSSTTATVHGKVVADEHGSPVRYAAVQLRRAGPGQESLTVTTNDSGVFEIHDVEPGTYSARAAKPGFVTTSYKNPGDDSGQLKLNAGQTEELTFRLPRSAAISGIIADAFGEPVNNASVQALVKRYSGGHVELTYRSSAQTDDRGEYRLYNLAAGRYYVEASKRTSLAEAGPELATTLFPAASRLENAQPVVLKPGEERQSINVTLQEAPVFDVIGRVLDESGQPAMNAFVNLMPMTGGGFNANDRAQPDGGFRIHNVAAGKYRLFITVSLDRNRPPLSVSRSLDLSNGNISDLVVRVGRGTTVSGTVHAVGGSLPADFQVSLSERTADGTVMSFFNATADADGDFEMEHVQPGSYELQVSARVRQGGPAPHFFLSSASVALGSVAAGRRDVTDTPVEVGDADSIELSVTIDLRTGGISGKALTAPDAATEVGDKPISGVNVVLISADPKKRLIARYFQSARSGRDGAFKLQGLAPGEYLLIPWPGEDAGQVLDSDVFTMIEKFATRITLERGEALTRDLRLTPELRTLADAFSQ